MLKLYSGERPFWQMYLIIKKIYLFNPIRSRGFLVLIFAITLRVFEVTLLNLATFPKINMKPGEIKNFSKLATMVTF